jgi:hypothetical protein
LGAKPLKWGTNKKFCLMKNYSYSQYKKFNQWVGWFTFAIATLVYLLTIEPTASFGIAASLLPAATS